VAPQNTDKPNGSPIKRKKRVSTTSSASTLDAPRRLVDLSTGLPSLTSLFSDMLPVVEHSRGTTVFYVHIPSSAIVEERFGWEALEAYRGLIANYIIGFAQDLRRDRTHCVLVRTYADDFALITPQGDNDEHIPTQLADGITRHLSAIDDETAPLLNVYVGVHRSPPLSRIHPERRLYRSIQQAQTEATDVERQQLSTQVRFLDRCIAQRQFLMLYQPIVRLEDHAIYGYEALVRCQQKELHKPHVLFNVAEQGERVWPLSRLLRGIAASSVPNMPDETYMFINMHPLDFGDPKLLEPEPTLAEHAGRIILEVTERATILDRERFPEQLRQLRDIGVGIAVDDLGSGYSSLSMVAELNPDFIKIDMTLIRSIDQSPVRQNLLRNMVSFAQDMGALVVAEGVETLEELKTVHDLGCHFVQGFYLAMPSPPFITTITQLSE
jgi:EAL domain-containing protein (putative c-di-GMP-specific phosphodiesterase class I)